MLRDRHLIHRDGLCKSYFWRRKGHGGEVMTRPN